MQSNSDLLSAKIEQSVLIHNAKGQFRNASYDDRKVNDLYRSFRNFTSWRHARRKLVYRVHTLVVTLAVTLHSTNDAYVDIDDIYRYVRFMPCRGSNMRFDENLNSNPML